MDPVCELTEIGQQVLDVALQIGERGCCRPFNPADLIAGQPNLHHQCDALLLNTVVDVPLDAAALGVLRRHDPSLDLASSSSRRVCVHNQRFRCAGRRVPAAPTSPEVPTPWSVISCSASSRMADPATDQVPDWPIGPTAGLLDHARRVYSERRQKLITALVARGFQAIGRPGLNVLVPVPEEGQVLQALRRAHWEVRAGERRRIETGPFIRVTSATMTASGANSSPQIWNPRSGPGR